MGTAADLDGQTIGQLTVLSRDEDDQFGHPTWRCRCSCGTEIVKRQWVLTKRKGHLTCGCRCAEFYAWRSMQQRCFDSKNIDFHNYGGRGISVCQRWIDSFDAFCEDMGPRPGPEYSLDRFPNNNGNYEKSNCRWATRDQQNANKRK